MGLMGLFFKLNIDRVFPLFMQNFKRNMTFEQNLTNINLCNVTAASSQVFGNRVILRVDPNSNSQNNIAVYTERNEHIGWISDVPNNNISIYNSLINNIPVLANVSDIKKNNTIPYIKITIALYEYNQPVQEPYQPMESDNYNYINYHKVKSMFPNKINAHVYDREHGEYITGIKYHDVTEAISLQVGDAVILEPCSSKYDAKGIKILSVNSKHLGWIPADSTYKSVMFKKLGNNIPILAKIYAINKTATQLQEHGSPSIRIIIIEYK